jgi:pimeloyl-ACP methyl ester carboxylesterase
MPKQTNSAPTRRTMMTGIAAASAGAIASHAAGSPARAQATAKTFVLVHGAWHGGWCWRRVADLLERRGHKVFAPTMTGLGERSHLADAKVGLGTHVTDIANVIKWEGLRDIVLCGHSYGGMVITALAERVQPAIASIVYLDAFVPEDGQALIDLGSQGVRQGIAAAAEKGETTLKPVPAAAFRVNEKDRAWVDAMCTPQPIATFTEKVAVTGAYGRVERRAYVRAKAYPNVAFDAAQAKLRSSAGWRIYDMDCGHDAMVDMPERLAEILLEVA